MVDKYYSNTWGKNIWVLRCFGSGAIDFKELKEIVNDFSEKINCSIESVLICEIRRGRYKNYKYIISSIKNQSPIKSAIIKEDVLSYLREVKYGGLIIISKYDNKKNVYNEGNLHFFLNHSNIHVYILPLSTHIEFVKEWKRNSGKQNIFNIEHWDHSIPEDPKDIENYFCVMIDID